jgi:hypothetical protein
MVELFLLLYFRGSLSMTADLRIAAQHRRKRYLEDGFISVNLYLRAALLIAPCFITGMKGWAFGGKRRVIICTSTHGAETSA